MPTELCFTSVIDLIFFGDDDDDFRKEDIGLGSGVRPNEYNGVAPKADKATEAFLQEVEKTLIAMAKKMVEEDNRKKNGGATTTTKNRVTICPEIGLNLAVSV